MTKITGYQLKDGKQCRNSFHRNPKFGRDQWKKAEFCSSNCSNKFRSTHGMRHTRLYKIWSGIKNRCLNENDKLFKDYGARGITICEEWKDNFEAFAKYMPPCPGQAFQVGRIENDLGYQPGNVRWETRTQNMRNKRSTKWVEIEGYSICLAELCDQKRLPYKKTWRRLRDGWPLEKAMQP